MHDHYVQIQANSYIDLGKKLGELFGTHTNQTLVEMKSEPSWERKKQQAKKLLLATNNYFPFLIEEVEGFAMAANISFIDCWTVFLASEFETPEKCTTILNPSMNVLGHNEDWTHETKDSICILEKTIGDLTVFELYYYDTFGGNALSINSFGTIQAINSLPQLPSCVGLPKDVIARWCSEQRIEDLSFRTFQDLPRTSGYHQLLLNFDGFGLSVESDANHVEYRTILSSFAHSNHHLSEKLSKQHDFLSESSRKRLLMASTASVSCKDKDAMFEVLSDTSQGCQHSIFNQDTIARCLVDLKEKQAYVWLLREQEKGWVTYPLTFLANDIMLQKEA